MSNLTIRTHKKAEASTSDMLSKTTSNMIFKTDKVLIVVQNEQGETIKEVEKDCVGEFRSLNQVIKFAADEILPFSRNLDDPAKWSVFDVDYTDYYVTLSTKVGVPFKEQGIVELYSIDVGCYSIVPAGAKAIDNAIADSDIERPRNSD